MVISYWSNIRKASVTTSLACMSSFFAMEGGCEREKSVVLENHYNINNLGSLILSSEKQFILREHGRYYDKYSVEYLLQHLYMDEMKEYLFSKSAIPLLFSNILYIPQSYVVNHEVFNYEFDLVRKKLFDYLQEYAETIHVDLESNENISTQNILHESDLVVVCLTQNPMQIRQYFDNYGALAKRAIYLIGSYKKNNPWTMERICVEYGIPKDKIAIIPYNEELLVASREGKILHFLHRNHLQSMNEENAYFVREVKKAVFMLKNNIQKIRRNEKNVTFE